MGDRKLLDNKEGGIEFLVFKIINRVSDRPISFVLCYIMQ